MQPALGFHNIISNVVSMIKISNGGGEGGVVSSTQVAIGEGATDGGGDVLLLGDKALVRALDRHESEAVPRSPLTIPTDAGLLSHCIE